MINEGNNVNGSKRDQLRHRQTQRESVINRETRREKIRVARPTVQCSVQQTSDVRPCEWMPSDGLVAR